MSTTTIEDDKRTDRRPAATTGRGDAMTVPKILGIDPSTSCTGLAGDGWTATIKTRSYRRVHELQREFVHTRMRHIIDTLGDYLTGVDLAIIEGPATGPGMDMDRQLAHLNWEIRDLLWAREVPYAVVNPTGLRRFALGKGSRSPKEKAADDAAGRTTKTATGEMVREWFPWFGGGNDEADAAVLYAVGRQWLGCPVFPATPKQLKALDAVAWPDLQVTLGVAA